MAPQVVETPADQAAQLMPMVPELPNLPPTDFFSETQWNVLFALMDGALPALTLESEVRDEHKQSAISEAQFRDALALARDQMVEPPSEELLKKYLEDMPSSYPGFVVGIQRTLSNVPDAAKKQLGAVLYALS